VIPLDEIRRVRRARIKDLLAEGLLRRTLPLSLGLTTRAVHVEPRSGMGYLVRVRNPGELLAVFAELGVTVEGSAAQSPEVGAV
jgi:hypothetical protein